MKQKSQWITSVLMAGGIFLLSASSCQVQQNSNSSSVNEGKDPNAGSVKPLEKEEHEQKPSWAQMMYDPNVNYFKAVKAYEAWYQEEEQKHSKEGKGKTEGSEEDHGEFASEKKKFNNWAKEMKPFVRPDGSIPSAEEREEIINRHNR